jgi:hypothetical protein
MELDAEPRSARASAPASPDAPWSPPPAARLPDGRHARSIPSLGPWPGPRGACSPLTCAQNEGRHRRLPRLYIRASTTHLAATTIAATTIASQIAHAIAQFPSMRASGCCVSSTARSAWGRSEPRAMKCAAGVDGPRTRSRVARCALANRVPTYPLEAGWMRGLTCRAVRCRCRPRCALCPPPPRPSPGLDWHDGNPQTPAGQGRLEPLGPRLGKAPPAVLWGTKHLSSSRANEVAPDGFAWALSSWAGPGCEATIRQHLALAALAHLLPRGPLQAPLVPPTRSQSAPGQLLPCVPLPLERPSTQRASWCSFERSQP